VNAIPEVRQEHGSRLQPADFFEMIHAVGPQISADGQRVAYVQYRADASRDVYECTVWVVTVSSRRQICLGEGTAPRWSSDGTRLAFLRHDGSAQQIFLWDAHDEQVSQLTHARESCSGIAWSPDGSQIACVKRVPEIVETPAPPAWATLRNEHWAAPGVYSERLIRGVEGVANDLPSGTYQVFLADVSSGHLTQLTHGTFDHGGPLASTVKVTRYGAISWAPDGASIVMSLNRTEAAAGAHDPHTAIACDVYEYRIATGEVRRLTRFNGVASNAAVSPDGRWIAFVGFRNRRRAFHTNVVYVLNRDGGELRALAHVQDMEVHSDFQWLPDSSGLLVLYPHHGAGCMARVGLDGAWRTVSRDVGGSTGSGYVMWDKAVSVSRDGVVAFSVASKEGPDEVAVATMATGETRRITHNNEALLRRREIGRVEELWFTSSAGQRRIQSWLVCPPDFNPRLKYPLVLWIHGGPYLSWGPHFTTTAQLLAARGYLVLMVNPRGSLGYGEEFTQLIHHAFPGDDYFDLVEAVDAVIARGHVDTGRLYVCGESGGGVLTSWLIGRTQRFAAAAMLYPITDWTSMALTVDRPDYYPYYWLPAPPWEAGMLEHYWRRSPLSLVGNVSTPTILLCGERDRRTPIAQSEMYFTALKLRGIATALVRFPDENHGMQCHPSHYLESIDHMDTWFRRFPGSPAP
jgi:acylaminoacyl-peptidase